MSTRHFWFPFQPGLWMGDKALRQCSHAARGFWMDMLSQMHGMEPQGVLPGDMTLLTRLLGTPEHEAAPLLEELEARNVFSRGCALSPRTRGEMRLAEELEGDAIVCRLMWRNWAAREAKRRSGRAGGCRKAQAEGLRKHEESGSRTATKAGATDLAQAIDNRGFVEGTQEQGKGESGNEGGSYNYRSELELKKDPEDPHTEPRGIAQVGDLLLGVVARLQGTGEPEGLADRIVAITGDAGPWAAWWAAVAALLDASAAGRAFIDAKLYEAGSLARQGELREPGRWLCLEVLGWCRSKRITVPDLPTRQGHPAAAVQGMQHDADAEIPILEPNGSGPG